MTVSRNAPCPCGSGKKHKLCCLPKREAPARALERPVGVATIRIDRAHVALGDLIPVEGYGLTNVDTVLRAIDVAIGQGVSAIVLEVDSLGGQPEAAFALYDALLSFREAGGRVVAFVPSDGYAASSAPLYVLAADAVVAHPRSFIGLHGICRPPSNPPWFPAWFRLVTRMCAAILLQHSLAPEAMVLEAIGTPGSARGESATWWLDAVEAKRRGFVDLIGDRARAQAIAMDLARGGRLDSKRQRGLAARGELVEHREELQRARALGAEVHRLGADAAHLRLSVARGSFNPADWFVVDPLTHQEKQMTSSQAVAIASLLASPACGGSLPESTAPHALDEVPVAAVVPGPWVPSANNIIGNASRTGMYRVHCPAAVTGYVVSGDAPGVTIGAYSNFADSTSYLIADSRITSDSVAVVTVAAAGVEVISYPDPGLGMVVATKKAGVVGPHTAWVAVIYP